VALASTVVPQGHSPLRFAVAALACLFVASSVPVAAASSAEEPERAAAAAAETASLLDVHDLFQGAFAAITDAVAEEVDAQPSQVSAAGKLRQQAPKRFGMNLFRKGDFSSQKTTFWCIPASTQMMMNMMDGGKPNRTRAMQARLYRIGDRLEEDGTFSPDPEPDRWRGMGISEWVGLLNRYDHGPYELAGAKSYRKSLRKAARMMRKTGKPVGLVVWHGAHAWVMSGFTATADPAVSKDFEVTSVWVQDPWYPRTSSIWGRSRGPNAKVSPGVLRQDFKRYGRPGRRNPDRDGRFMLVLPRPDREARTASSRAAS
jgi:hypothetical protein